MIELVTNYQPGIDVVVINYHTMDDLENFIMSYGHDTVESTLHIINVEETLEERRKTERLLSKVDGLKYHGGFPDNVGYARACNEGASKGQREVLALFNADTQLYTDTLSKCHEGLMTNADWGVLGPLQVDSHGRVTHGGILGTNSSPYQRGWYRRDISKFRDIQEDAVSVMGSAYFIKRSVWDELSDCKIYKHHYPYAAGAFLETPHYFEETFCSYHAREHGHKVVYYGEAMMVHEWHKSSPKGFTEKKYYGISQAMFREACEFHGIEHNA
jgi:GT2 family glycosyltransferase